ncbi:copper amine oxidase N-terminal domain-containing protein [Paenibacillus whitsoniae]|uniref:Copper amine oxidase N-terminal domain-containing protein n=1 Tax=Paenibacillus whitsoniae TaxID=2496558 RepID=A0A430J517_9BACL|nr:copper amine oxidase N-terminal domain-containing protein [Paenibacillus whitsoniae]RTE02765.1 copper amine oxidase N-terminal domain-containing protein [Paenibacillus whitsoniae]
MKKIVSAIISFVIASTLCMQTTFAAELKMKINNESVHFEYGTPFIDNGSSLIPLRDLLISLGVANDDQHIQWNAAEQSVTIAKDDKIVKLRVGATDIFLNGELFKKLEVPAQNVDGRVYLPARAVAEALGYFVGYDAETSTVLVQEKPFGGGVKADDYGNSEIAVPSAGDSALDSLKFGLAAYHVSLPVDSERAINNNSSTFFASGSNPLSLDKIAKPTAPEDIVKNVSAYHSSIVNVTFLKIDEIKDFTLDNGKTLTLAIGHTGGETSPVSNSWVDDTYFQVFFAGSAPAAKGDKVTVNGVPVGESTIELTTALGKPVVEPVVLLAAGNLIKTSDEYDLRSEQSRSNTGNIVIPELEKAWKTKIDGLQVNMTGDKITITSRRTTDSAVNGTYVNVKSVQAENYSYTPSSPLEIPLGQNGLNISLKDLVDKTGKSLQPSNGQTFFVKIEVVQGVSSRVDSVVRFVEYKN